MYGCESWSIKLSAKELMLLNCGVGEDSWESLGLQGDPTSKPKGNQSGIFIWRIDAEAPIFWPSDENWFTGKDLDVSQDWEQYEKETTEDEMVRWYHWLNGYESEQAPGITQTHVHWVNDAIQPFHPLSSPSPSAFNLSQYQGLFQWVSSSHQVAKYWGFSFNIIPSNEYSRMISFRIDWLTYLLSKGLSRVFSNTTVQKHQFFDTRPSSQSNSHIHTWPQEKP